MKIHKRVVIDIATNAVVEDQWYEYSGPVARCDDVFGGGDSPPPPSEEELALQSEQAELLRFQRQQLERQLGLQNLLAPFLFEELGLSPQFGPAGEFTDEQAAQLESLRRQREELSQQPSGPRKAIDVLPGLLGKQRPGGSSEELQRLDAEIAELERLQQLSQDQIITGFEDIPPTEAELLREEIELALLERSQAALRGELPVSPTLEREIEEAGGTLRERLRRNLGPGFETSTPGTRALSDFTQRAIEAREGARRGELTLSEQLSLARSGQMFSQAGATRAQLSALPAMRPDFTNLIAGFNAPLNRMAQDRWQQFLFESQQPSFGSTLGQMLGIGAGAAFGSIGSTIGSQIGKDLFD